MGSIRDNCLKEDILVGSLCLCSNYCSNQSLKFVNYPFMALSKSNKILSVIMVGWVMGTQPFILSQAIVAIIIVIGLIIFNFS